MKIYSFNKITNNNINNKNKQRFPHPVTLAGMLEMGTMYLPINQNWFKYIASCEKNYEDSEIILKKLLEKSANEACTFINQKEYTIILINLFE